MDRKTKICVWVILAGMANFFLFAILYMFFDGEAIHGSTEPGSFGTTRYFLLSSDHQNLAVSKAIYFYSGIHCITIWPTVGAVMLAMLTLAKERVVLSMRTGFMRGRTFCTVLATIIAMMMIALTIWFTVHFVHSLSPKPSAGPIDVVSSADSSWR